MIYLEKCLIFLLFGITLSKPAKQNADTSQPYKDLSAMPDVGYNQTFVCKNTKKERLNQLYYVNLHKYILRK